MSIYWKSRVLALLTAAVIAGCQLMVADAFAANAGEETKHDARGEAIAEIPVSAAKPPRTLVRGAGKPAGILSTTGALDY